MASQRFACGFENAPHLGRISPIFRDLQGLGPADPIVAAQEMEEAVGERPGISYAVEATEYCLKQCRRNPDPKGFLAPEDAATIKLYTSEDETQPNLYSEMNARCYSSERNRFLFPCKKYMWNLLHALKKLPPYEKGTVVNRGVKKALVTEEPEKYKKGQVLTWWGFSSCTKDADVLRNPQFMGTTGPRTLFNIELTQHIARDISDYSLLPEGEVLLPPGVTFEIASILDAGSGLHMVCLKEIEPDDIILELRQRTHSGGQTIMHAQATAASSLAASKVAPPAAKPTHTRPLASAAVPAADLYLPGGTRGVGATVIGQTDAKDSQADKDGARDRRDDRGGDNSDRRYRSRSRGGRRSRSNRRGGRSRSNRRDGGRQRGRWSRSPRRAEPAKPRRNTGFTSAPADPSQVVATKPAGSQFSDEMNNVQLKASEVPDWLQDLANPQPRTHGRKVLRMPDTYIKCLIGKGGETIRSIINRTGADIQIEGKSTDSEANVSIAGNVEPAENLIRDILKSKGCPWQTQSGTILQRGGAVPLTTVGWKPDVDTDDIQIPTELVGLFIGNAGAGLKEIKQRCGAGNFIKILPDILPGGLQCIQVVGDNWRNAREQVRQKVEEIKKMTPGRWHAPAFRKNDPNHGGSNAGVATADHTGGYMSGFGATPGYNSGQSHMGVRSVINQNQNWGAGSTLI